MAANEINQKQLIPGAYITLVHKDSFPANNGTVTEAVYASVTLIQEGVIAVIGDVSSSWTTLSAMLTGTLEIPQCSFTASASKYNPLSVFRCKKKKILKNLKLNDEIVGFSDKTQYKYFYRTIPTKITIADAMLDFVVTQQWKNIGVIYSNDLLGQHCKLFFFCYSLVQSTTNRAWQFIRKS